MKALTVIFGSLLSLSTMAAHTPGAVSCDGSEIHGGTYNEARYLYLIGYGGTPVKAEDSRRNISLESYFKMPRVTMNGSGSATMQEGLTKVLSMHAAASQFGISGLTKALVKTNSKIKTFTYNDLDKRALEKLSVTISGKNKSSITCTQSVPKTARLNNAGSLENMGEYITVTNGDIIRPTSLWTYTCTLKGKIQDMGLALHTALKEVYTLNVENDVIYEAELIALGFDIAYQNYSERGLARENFMDFASPGIAIRNYSSGKFLGLAPINKTIINEDYSTTPTLRLDETLNAKAFGLFGSRTCNVNLICTKDSCDFLTNEEVTQASEVLSAAE